jgi:glycosyltransferase involved in cell wall biosynthesis
MASNISLCIPTYKRFDKFLSVNIKRYLENPYINEIVICDENGEDCRKIAEHFPNEPKLRLYVNESVLGAFGNKNRVVSLASNEWVCLMDSDNYAPPSYFEAWISYVESNGLSPKNIYLPMYTIPQPNHNGFNYTEFQHLTLDGTHISQYNLDQLSCMLNTGNYIFHKHNYTTSNRYLTEYHTSGVKGGQDVIFKSILLFLNHSRLVLVPNMAYDHIVHDGSLFLNNVHEYQQTYQLIKQLFGNILNYYDTVESATVTLEKWQQMIKPRKEWLYNCSEYEYKNDEWVSFPIGMGWKIINHNYSLPVLQYGTHDKLVLCAIYPDTDKNRRQTGTNRQSILETLRSKQIENTYLDSSVYYTELPKYKFVISPEGNGIDCHRHYEALMAGCIPIVEDNDMIRKKYEGCPILYTKDYSEITESYLTEKYNEMKGAVYDFSRLLLSTYSASDQTQIKNNGNYWSKQLSGQQWYNT